MKPRVQVDKSNKPWHVKYVSQATRNRFKDYADKKGISLADALDIASKKL